MMIDPMITPPVDVSIPEIYSDEMQRQMRNYQREIDRRNLFNWLGQRHIRHRSVEQSIRSDWLKVFGDLDKVLPR